MIIKRINDVIFIFCFSTAMLKKSFLHFTTRCWKIASKSSASNCIFSFELWDGIIWERALSLTEWLHGIMLMIHIHPLKWGCPGDVTACLSSQAPAYAKCDARLPSSTQEINRNSSAKTPFLSYYLRILHFFEKQHFNCLLLLLQLVFKKINSIFCNKLMQRVRVCRT